MKHPEIDDQAVVDHYVAGKLSATEAAQFEEHYLGCPACIRAIEDAERLQRGLGVVAAEDLATRQSLLAAAWQAARSKSGALLAAALLAVALLPAGLVWQRAGRLGTDLDEARRALADERRPRINTPVLALVATRAGQQPLQQISLLAEPEWIVLAIELGETARPRYEARLSAADGTTLWASKGLEPSFRGDLTMSLHSSLLPPEEYVLHLTADDHALDFPLRVVAAD